MLNKTRSNRQCGIELRRFFSCYGVIAAGIQLAARFGISNAKYDDRKEMTYSMGFASGLITFIPGTLSVLAGEIMFR